MKRFQCIAVAAALAVLVQTSARAQSSVSYSGGTYSQNFDSLPYTPGTAVNTADPVVINSQTYTFSGAANNVFDFAANIDGSGVTNSSTGGLGLSSTMSGWYGSDAVLTRFGAQEGSQTTGGIISFGGLSSSNRALGLMGTSTTGISTFGLKLINNTGSDISAINLSFVGELWRQQATAKTIGFGYVETSNTALSLPVSGVTSLGSFGFATGASGAVDGTSAANQTNINLSAQSISTWHNGDALWLTWQISSAASSAQGLAIDNLSFSAVPEPSTFVLVGAGMLGMLALRRRR